MLRDWMSLIRSLIIEGNKLTTNDHFTYFGSCFSNSGCVVLGCKYPSIYGRTLDWSNRTSIVAPQNQLTNLMVWITAISRLSWLVLCAVYGFLFFGSFNHNCFCLAFCDYLSFGSDPALAITKNRLRRIHHTNHCFTLFLHYFGILSKLLRIVLMTRLFFTRIDIEMRTRKLQLNADRRRSDGLDFCHFEVPISKSSICRWFWLYVGIPYLGRC